MFAVNPCVVTLGGAQKTHDARKSDELLKRPQVAVDWLPQCGQQAANAGLAGHLRWLQRDNTNNYNTTSSPLLVQLLLLLMLRVADPLREWPTESGVYRQYRDAHYVHRTAKNKQSHFANGVGCRPGRICGCEFWAAAGCYLTAARGCWNSAASSVILTS